MQGRAFLQVAQRLVNEKAEADWRTAAGRAYYALFLEARALLVRWGFKLARRDNIHSLVRLRFVYATDSDLRTLGQTMEQLIQLRNHADYEPDQPGSFSSVATVRQAVMDAQQAIAWLDQIDGDPVRRAAAIAGIRAAFPSQTP